MLHNFSSVLCFDTFDHNFMAYYDESVNNKSALFLRHSPRCVMRFGEVPNGESPSTVVVVD